MATKYEKWWKNVGKNIKNFFTDVVDTVTGRSEKEHLKKADELAQQSQDFNEQYSKEALQEQARQFEVTNAQAKQNIDWQKEQAEKNFAMQQDVFAAQQAENALTREREDNAYQRQVADLKAAGLSPLMASNGAGATNIDVGSAPQLETQAVSTAQGSAIQLAQEYAELRNMAKGQYLTRRQEAFNQRIGAKMALSQLDKERRLGFQNMILDSINTATNISRARWANMESQQQIDYSKAKLKWENDNGFRNRDPWNTLVPILTKISDNMNFDPKEFGKALGESIKLSSPNIQFSFDLAKLWETNPKEAFNITKNNVEVLKGSEMDYSDYQTLINVLQSGTKDNDLISKLYNEQNETFKNKYSFKNFEKACKGNNLYSSSIFKYLMFGY